MPVIVSADVFGHVPIIQNICAGDDVVEEGAVVTDEQERTIVFKQEVFDDFEGFAIVCS